VTLTWAQVAAWRMARQGLAPRLPVAEAVALAGRLGGLQAQIMSSAELTLWARVDGLAPDFVSRALWEERALVKTWAQRGTLHLIPAEQFWRVQAALGTYTHFLKPSWSKAFGVAPDELGALIAAIADALAGEPLSREALSRDVARRLGDPSLEMRLSESWGALLKPAAFRGVLCFAPGDGRSVRFTRPDVWLGGREDVDGEAALLDMARAFLAAHGPATREDLARWWALSPAKAGKLLRALGEAGEAVEAEVEGARGWLAPDAVEEVAASASSGVVRLLGAFDQYVLASTKHADVLLPDPSLRARVHRAQGWVSPVVLMDGRMVGVWRHERAGKALRVTVEPFPGRRPRGLTGGVKEEVDRLAAFLGGAPELSWT
jgi:uncharacterized protein YcaQ